MPFDEWSRSTLPVDAAIPGKPEEETRGRVSSNLSRPGSNFVQRFPKGASSTGSSGWLDRFDSGSSSSSSRSRNGGSRKTQSR
ncbi:hypothetical protein BKA70DRAFT_1438015 [Coprinopsis sp. MPI-PUGE-AT-0042]|nr:hypothetical protein BKA70DRAFT_1438015 [Coprinopsis sp. MPI-PUGE-AT-0042]